MVNPVAVTAPVIFKPPPVIENPSKYPFGNVAVPPSTASGPLIVEAPSVKLALPIV